MKRNFYLLAICAALLTIGSSTASADDYIFDRLAVGIEAGTAGAGVEVAVPATRFVTLRAGVSALPAIGKSFTIPYSINRVQYSTIVEGKVNKIDGKILADIYPFPKGGFHLTTGLYMGTPDFIRVQNTAPLQGISRGEGIQIGGMLITPDDQGYVKANIKAAAVKPYFGLGFGRPVSDHHLNFAMDFGVQYWGKITVNAWSPEEEAWATVTPGDINNNEAEKYLDLISRIPIFPVINLRLYYCF